MTHLGDMFCINEGEDRIEENRLLDLLIDEKGLDHWCGVGQAGGLNEDGVESRPSLEQLVQDADEVAPNCAAYASIVHLKDLLLCLDGLHD